MDAADARALSSNGMKKFLLFPLSAALLAGCAAINPAGSSAKQPGMACSRCEAVWVQAPSRAGKPGSVMLYRGQPRHVCSQCNRMALQFFSTGKIGGTCPECGKSLHTCTVEVIPPAKKSS